MFERLSFTIEAGDALVLRGRNGSGKSTLLRLLACFLPLASGELFWGTGAVAAAPEEHRQRLHYVGHSDGLKSALTAGENLGFAARLMGGGSGAVSQGLAAFALEHLRDTAVRYLSAGQKRRLALARLVAVSRPLWLLDEPGVGLDRDSRISLQRAIDRHRGSGGVCVLATHGDVEVADPLLLDFD